MPFEPCPRRGCRAEQRRCGHCYPEGCAATSFVPCQRNTRRPLSKLEGNLLPRKITVTSKSPVGDISVVTLIRTDTTLDHSQKAEKVCSDKHHACFGGNQPRQDSAVDKRGQYNCKPQASGCFHASLAVGRNSSISQRRQLKKHTIRVPEKRKVALRAKPWKRCRRGAQQTCTTGGGRLP